MKTIGLIGGMSWESTVTYYKLINEAVKARLGGLHSARCILYSVDFHEIEACQAKGDWEKSADLLSEAAISLEKAGAEVLLICTNTMHKVAPQLEKRVSIPLLHIAKATAEELLQSGIKQIALLGTRYTMQQDFYKSKLIEKGLEVLLPTEADMERINTVIFQELCLGILSEESKKEFLRIISYLAEQGAEGVILGCTEIGLLIKQEDTKVKLFDTTYIHANQAVNFAMQN